MSTNTQDASKLRSGLIKSRSVTAAESSPPSGNVGADTSDWDQVLIVVSGNAAGLADFQVFHQIGGFEAPTNPSSQWIPGKYINDVGLVGPSSLGVTPSLWVEDCQKSDRVQVLLRSLTTVTTVYIKIYGLTPTGGQLVSTYPPNPVLTVSPGSKVIITDGTNDAAVNASGGLEVSGDVAHDAADAGNPLKIGGKAAASEPTAVSADADRVNAYFDLTGYQWVKPQGGVASGAADSGNPVKVGAKANAADPAIDENDRADLSVTLGSRLRTDVTGNVANAATDSGNPVKVAGVFRSSPQTLTTGQRGDLSIDAGGRAEVVGPGAAGATAVGAPVRVAGIYQTSLPTLTDGQTGNVELDASGRQLVVASGDVAHDSPDSGNPVKVGGKASLVDPGAVTAGDREELSLTLTGRLRVDVDGNVAHDAIDYGNPVKIGGLAAAAATDPTAVLAGDRVAAYFDLNGYQRVKVQGPADLDAAALGGPVRVGGVFRTAPGEQLDTGDQGDLAVDDYSRLIVVGQVADNVAAQADGPVKTGTVYVAAPADHADGDIAQFVVDLKGRQIITGEVAHDAPDVGFPLKLGGKSASSEPTAVDNPGDRVNAYFDLNGYQRVKVQGTAATNDTAVGGPVQAGGVYDPTLAVASANDVIPLQVDNAGRQMVVGPVAENAAAVGNPLQVGGRYDATPRTLGDGDVGGLAVDVSGKALVIAQGTAATNAAAVGNPLQVGGVYQPTLAAPDANDMIPIQVDGSGRPLVTGAAAENAAAAGNPLLVGGRYDLAPRTLGDGDVGAVALTPTGQVMVAGLVADNAAVGADGPVKTGGVYDATPDDHTDGDVAQFLTDIKGRQLVVASGDVAAAASDSGNPVKVGGLVETNDPTVVAGNRAPLSFTTAGRARTDALVRGPVADNVAAAGNPIQNGAVYSPTVAPAPTAGDILSNTCDAAGNQIVVGPGAAEDPISGNPVRVAGKYDATPPTLTDGDTGELMLDVNGRQLVVASGDVAAAAVDSGNPVKVGGLVETADPTVVNGNRASVSITTAGRVRVDGLVAGMAAYDAAAAGNPVRVGGVYRSTPDQIQDGDQSDLSVDDYSRVHVVGPAAHDAAALGAPVRSGGVFHSAAPAGTDGDVLDLRTDAAGNQMVVGPAADKAAAAGNPVSMGGTYVVSPDDHADGNAARLLTDVKGHLLVAGSGSFNVVGDIAHDATDSGAPVKIGARAITGVMTPSVTTGDRTDLSATLEGRLRVDVDDNLEPQDNLGAIITLGAGSVRQGAFTVGKLYKYWATVPCHVVTGGVAIEATTSDPAIPSDHMVSWRPVTGRDYLAAIVVTSGPTGYLYIGKWEA